MELDVIQNLEEINKCDKLLFNLMKEHSNKSEKKLRFSTRGGGQEIDVFTFKHDNNTFWYSNSRETNKYKYFNLFGFNPDFDRTNNILVQVNYQKEFRNFREGGIWAKDAFNNIYLLHSGKMGGGVAGISIKNIDNFYGGQKVVAKQNGNKKEYFVVCQIESTRSFNQLISFLIEIKKIKGIIKADEPNVVRGSKNESGAKGKVKFKLPNKYTPEFWGKRKSYFRKGKTESISDHGAVVDALRIKLERECGYFDKCTNNQFIDLGIEKGGKPIAIFEFKTSIGTQSIYTAIGQVLLHSHSTNLNPLKFVVFPDELDNDIEKDLLKLNIKTIRYKWIKNKVRFYNLQQIPKY